MHIALAVAFLCAAKCQVSENAAAPLHSGQVIRLWSGAAPGALGTNAEDIPELTVYAPENGRGNGAAMIVCPGGGYSGLAAHEAGPPAEWLATLGVAAFVLKYRLGPGYHHPAMLRDAQRAIRTVRAHAGVWDIDPDRIGILGFSAGGHLASTAATHLDAGDPRAQDLIDRASSRPSVAVLIYPVLTMTRPYTHEGSRDNLLGKRPSRDLVDLLSNEKQVTSQTPPCFIVSSAADKVVPCENSLMFAAALHKAGVPFALHIFQHGEHGFGMGGADPELSAWPRLCAAWLKQEGFLGQ